MKRSTERILTTHVGSLPRPLELVELLKAREEGTLKDIVAFEKMVHASVEDSVKQQVENHIDVISDGEMGRANYATYIKDRLNGFEGKGDPQPPNPDANEFPEWQVFARMIAAPITARHACVGPITWKDFSAVETDIANVKAAAAKYKPAGEVFLTSASPGNLPGRLQNKYYKTDEEYIYAIAEVMKREYKAIVDAGLILQVDCPDLALDRGGRLRALPLEEYRRVETMHVEALNYATKGLPADKMRIHVCWASTAGPHHRDVELKDIADIIIKANPSAISVVAANPRHEYEWKVWKEVKLPADKILIPGVIDSTSNFVEHPETVAERLDKFVSVLGRERVMAGTDCGFGTFAGRAQVDRKIMWLKFKSMAEGARIATKRLAAR